MPREVYITVATNGWANLYVNGYNVTTSLLTPYRDTGDNRCLQQTFDISNYIVSGTNVIAIRQSPTTWNITAQDLYTKLYGTDNQGYAFADISNEAWLCCEANRQQMPNDTTLQDGRIDPFVMLKADKITLNWIPVANEKDNTQPQIITPVIYNNTAIKVVKIHEPQYIDYQKNKLIAYFDKMYTGYIRITMRGTQPNKQIIINQLIYITRGETDEQAYTSLTNKPIRTVYIHGDKSFQTSMIQSIELLETTRTNLKM